MGRECSLSPRNAIVSSFETLYGTYRRNYLETHLKLERTHSTVYSLTQQPKTFYISWMTYVDF
jgi:hypothetical protein